MLVWPPEMPCPAALWTTDSLGNICRYKESVTAPITAALDSYEDSWSNGYAMTPLPLHKDELPMDLHDRHRNDSRPVDVHFELLRLARVGSSIADHGDSSFLLSTAIHISRCVVGLACGHSRVAIGSGADSYSQSRTKAAHEHLPICIDSPVQSMSTDAQPFIVLLGGCITSYRGLLLQQLWFRAAQITGPCLLVMMPIHTLLCPQVSQ